MVTVAKTGRLSKNTCWRVLLKPFIFIDENLQTKLFGSKLLSCSIVNTVLITFVLQFEFKGPSTFIYLAFLNINRTVNPQLKSVSLKLMNDSDEPSIDSQPPTSRPSSSPVYFSVTWLWFWSSSSSHAVSPPSSEQL